VNILQILSTQPWVERLGWTLIHFLWQGLAIAVLYAVARRRLARAASPNARYLLACAALTAMLAAPLLTWGLLRPADTNPDAAYRIQSTPPAASTTGIAPTAALPTSVRAAVSGVKPSQFLLWVVMVWLAGALVFWVRLAGGWVVAARMRSVLVRHAPPEWQEILNDLSAWLGLSRPVRLLVSALVQVPTVVGWLRPVVLVPVGVLGGLPAEHLEMLLLHELAHIRRHDYLFNLLQSVAEALLFYHPAVWWVSGHIRSERELCCDAVAVSVNGDALTYAQALMELESYRPAHVNAAVAANGGSLPDRIARLLGQSRPAVRTGLGPGVLAVAILLLAAAYGLFGQSDAHPAFAVASIKRNTSVSSDPTRQPMGVRMEPGGRLRAQNAPLTLLIQRAYGIQAFQVAGGPAWIDSPGYDIEAKPEDTTDRKQMLLMLQTLLAERFKLSLHRETRELPVYDLKVAKSGSKLPVSKEVNCMSMPSDGTPPIAPNPGQALCGYVAGPMGEWSTYAVLRLQGSKVHMADFISKLALVLGRPVLDKTEFTRDFDLNLKFTADETTIGLPGFGGPGDPGGHRLPTDPNLPNIFAALQEQLGLKLASAKGPVEVLVVDHVERPTAN
jgi:uncharacterized protein (TIGR03435 family)